MLRVKNYDHTDRAEPSKFEFFSVPHHPTGREDPAPTDSPRARNRRRAITRTPERAPWATLALTHSRALPLFPPSLWGL